MLVVEDDTIKLGQVHQVLVEAGVEPDRIHQALNAAQAVDRLGQLQYDLMLLDINLPRRFGEPPRRGGGMDVLNELRRAPDLHRPRYIVGITAFEDIVAEFGDSFTEQLWTLVHYQESSDFWKSQVKSKVEYIRAVRASDNFTDGQTFGIDLAIVCALEDVELAAVKRLPCGWQPLRRPHDETRYITGSINGRDRTLSIVAASPPRMGMAASGTLASKMIASFRPRYLVMLGICAGRFEKAGLGDIVIADPVWDWGSGKVDAKDNKPRFRPAPHQLDLDVDLFEELREFCQDVARLARIKDAARGNKPTSQLKAQIGPMASGAAVVANPAIFEMLLDQEHRNLIAIEMEAYAIAVATRGSGKPRPTPLIIKSVCDFADQDKDDDYQEYAAETSALFFHEVAQHLL